MIVMGGGRVTMMMMMLIESTLAGCEDSTIYYALALRRVPSIYIFIIPLLLFAPQTVESRRNEKIKFPEYTPMALQWILQV